MAASFKVSEEAMINAGNEYSDYADRMETLQKTLKTAVEEIRGGWDSDGGKAFFEKFDDEWYKNFTDYINVIRHMASNVNNAKTKYEPLFEYAEKMKLE